MIDYKEYLTHFRTLVFDHPLVFAIFFVDFWILVFHRPPFMFSFPMMLGLILLAMYFAREITKIEIAVSAESGAKPSVL